MVGIGRDHKGEDDKVVVRKMAQKATSSGSDNKDQLLIGASKGTSR